jgi:hypothetical protein
MLVSVFQISFYANIPVFSHCKEEKKALGAFRAGLDYKNTVSVAQSLGYTSQDIVALCRELAQQLITALRFVEAAHVLETYCADFQGALQVLMTGSEWMLASERVSSFQPFHSKRCSVKRKKCSSS